MAILCQCEGVRDREIDAAVASGAHTIEAVGEACRAGTGCGTCHPWIVEALARAGVTCAMGATASAAGE